MLTMGSASSQVQMEEDINDAAKAFKHEESTPKPIKKTPRTYSKRKRAASPERGPNTQAAMAAAAQPLSSSTTQDKVGSAKRRRADKESRDLQDLSGKENRDPDTGAGSSEQEEQEQEEESSSPPMKKQKGQPAAAAAPPSPPPTQQSKTTARKAREESSGVKLSRDGRIFQRTLEARLALPEKTFQPGHVSETNQKRTGWFSPQEIKTLEKFKEEFCLENGLHGDTFDQFIQSSTKERIELFKRSVSHMTVMEFWNSVYLRMPQRDRRSIARFMRRHFVAGRKPYDWTPRDDDELERLHRIHGPKWSIVASEMERTQDDVTQRWKNKVEHRSTMNRGAWSKEEVEKLMEVIEKSRGFLASEQSFDVGKDIYEMDDKYISWGAVSDFFGHTRSRQQCADKWRKVRSRVLLERSTGKKDATFFDVYDFSIPISAPPSHSKSEQPRPSSSRRKKLSDDYVNSEDDEEEEEEEEVDASDDDNLSALGPLPLQTSAGDENEEDISTQEPEEPTKQEPDRDESANTHDHHHKHHSSLNPDPENDDESDNNPSSSPSPEQTQSQPQSRTQQFTPINPPLPQPSSSTPSTSTHQKHKRSKAEKAERAAAKAAAKEERKRARRAQKRAILEEREREREVSIKRESTQESSLA